MAIDTNKEINRILGFPNSIYPFDFDSDYTLFKVFNNTQSILSESLPADSTTISIIAELPSDVEVWPDNGFATIQDELIYYDDVTKNASGKVCILKKCYRGLEGEAKNYPAGTQIFGNVVAQTHNQLAEAIIQIETVIGELADALNRTPAPSKDFNVPAMIDSEFSRSLQQNLTNLLSYTYANDDTCPQVDVEFNVDIPVAAGTTAEFCVRIYPWDASWDYTLDFGDGDIETVLFAGTHEYPGVGGPFTPTVTITTPTCTVVQQAHALDAGLELEPSVSPVQAFHIPIPEVPNFPSFVSPRKVCPGPLMNLPPILIPSMSLCSTASACSIVISVADIILPSQVSIVGCCPPSQISIVGCCPPSVISMTCCTLPSIISVQGNVQLPSIINITGCCPPSVISLVGCCIPSTISIQCCPIPSTISITSARPIPSVISVTNPNIPSVVSLICCNIPSVISFVSCCRIPSIISVTCCDMPSIISFGPVNIPSVINIAVNVPSVINVTGNVSLPSIISFGPCCNIPSVISFVSCCRIPSVISVVCCPMPSIISFGPCCTIPTQITFGPVNIPTQIKFGPVNIPSVISVVCCPMPSIISFGPCCTIPTQITFGPVNIPTQIKFGPVNIPSVISVVCCPMPSIISFGPCCTIPTQITFGPVNIPTQITFGPVNIPSVISVVCCPMPSIISFGPCCTIPTQITFGPVNIPTQITFGSVNIPSIITFSPIAPLPNIIYFSPVSIPNTITFLSCCTLPSVISMTCCTLPSIISFAPAPSVVVAWGTPPTLSCVVTVNCGSQSFAAANSSNYPYDPDLEGFGELPVDVGNLGIPDEIKLFHDLPREILMRASNLPEEIKLIGPDKPLPEQISIIHDLPKEIHLLSDVPKVIKVDASEIPQVIRLEPAKDFPSTIHVVGMPDKIQVVGIPPTIEVIGIPNQIQLVMPEDPTIELVWKGGPIPVAFSKDQEKILSNIII